MPAEDSKFDVVIVGAGTIGLFLAHLLQAKNVKVCIVERGGITPVNPRESEFEMVASEYGGALRGRTFCLGGTSTIWGGALIPFRDKDRDLFLNFVDKRELQNGIHSVEDFFEISHGSYENCEISVGDFFADSYSIREAKWPKFRSRNSFTQFLKKSHRMNRIKIFTGTKNLRFDNSGEKIRFVSFIDNEEEFQLIHAKVFVICAGALESTKILMHTARQGRMVLPKLGKNFSDHISLRIAKVTTINRREFNRTFGYRFDSNGGMSNLRFESDYLSQDGSIPYFLHFSFKSESDSFLAVRNVLQSIQRRRLPTVSDFTKVVSDLPWMLRAIFWRLVHKRVLYPDDAKVDVHCVIEKPTDIHNFLDMEFSESIEESKLLISWSVPKNLLNVFKEIQATLIRNWENSNFAKFGEMIPVTITSETAENFQGIYHPTGTTSVDHVGDKGVVDGNLRVKGWNNLFTVSTAVLPNSRAVNPTMEALILASRLSNHLLFVTNDHISN